MPRVRDEVQGWDPRPQWDSDTRGEVLLFFLVCTGEYIYNVKILNEKLTTDKFYFLSKGPETCMKIQHPKLPYLAHNTCSAITGTPQYLQVARLMLGQSDMLTWPHYFDILICQCPQQLFYWTIKLLLCGTKLGFTMSMRCWPKANIIGNGWKWSGTVRIGHVTSVTCGTITWSSANNAKIHT